jgi:endonuclease YncB( thermonuclease family)
MFMQAIRKVVAAALIALALTASAETVTGKVVGVTDGDTITVLTEKNRQVTIRLADIDAPEKNQPFGRVSRQALSDAVFFKAVTVNVIKIDKYGRSVGYVLVDGEDVNRKQLQGGHAWVYREYLSRKSYLGDEDAAKRGRIGLWKDNNPQPPWEYRHGKKGSSTLMTDADGNTVTRSKGTGEAQTRIADQMFSHVPANVYGGGGSSYGGGSYGGSGTVHTGPRGGQYTITSGGNKSYIPKK